LADDPEDFDADEATAIVRVADIQKSSEKSIDHHLLVHVQGTEMGRVRALDKPAMLIGRSTDADIWLSDDGVSRKHARFVRQGNVTVIEDLESANGTFVQGEKVARRVLKTGDQIQLGPTALFRYSITDNDQRALLEQLYSTSVTDSLTGARNREYLDTLMVSELSYAKRHEHDISFLLFDLDHFKRINDTFGHPAGDAVLVAVSATVRSTLRAEDALCRYGGEEFCVLLRSIDLAGAATLAERIRALIAELRVVHDGHTIPVTASIGCSSRAELLEPSASGLVALADRRLYKAKAQGRNRVVAEG
jgi:two-component system cell cycle response regulator